MKKYASIYSIFVGVCMIGMWILFYVTESIPELKTNPIEIIIHIIAEFITGILLILAGVSILLKKAWSYKLYLVSSGMLVYTIINSSGYFLERGDIAMTTMFYLLLIPLVVFIVKVSKEK